MKVLIVTETIAGKGHEKAAQSLLKVMEQHRNVEEVKIVSLLAIFDKNIEKLVKWIYMLMIKRTPFIWHFMYKKEANFAFFFKEVIAIILLFKLKRYLAKEKPDLVVATHATGLGALSKLKNSFPFTLAAVFTDYQVNKFWINKNIDYYFVPHADLKNKLLHYGKVKEEKIIVSGIPIDPIFYYAQNQQYKTDEELFSILIMGGGLGLGGMIEILKEINKVKEIPLKVSVVTGTNNQLYDEITGFKHHVNYPIIVYGYVENIHQLMNTSKLLISKAGGLTIAEAMSVPIPMIIYKSLPGQEEHNVKFLTDKGAAIKMNRVEEVSKWIDLLYQNGDYYNHLLHKMKEIAKPDASLYITSKLMNEEGHQEYHMQH